MLTAILTTVLTTPMDHCLLLSTAWRLVLLAVHITAHMDHGLLLFTAGRLVLLAVHVAAHQKPLSIAVSEPPLLPIPIGPHLNLLPVLPIMLLTVAMDRWLLVHAAHHLALLTVPMDRWLMMHAVHHLALLTVPMHHRLLYVAVNCVLLVLAIDR